MKLEEQNAINELKAAAWKLAAITGRRNAGDILHSLVNEVVNGTSGSTRGTSQFEDAAQQWDR